MPSPMAAVLHPHAEPASGSGHPLGWRRRAVSSAATQDAASCHPGAYPQFLFSGGDMRNVFITDVFCYLLEAS